MLALLQYPDNTPVPDTLVGTAFEWKSASYPINDNVSECVAFDASASASTTAKVVNIDCNIAGEEVCRVNFVKWIKSKNINYPLC